MKFTQHESEDIKVDLTSMIDVVFQLLAFFVMTFKVVGMEADFNVRMPLASTDSKSLDPILPDVINVKLNAGPNGNISSVEANGNTFVSETVDGMYLKLTDYVESSLAGASNPEDAKETEVEFDINNNLQYRYTVMGIEAVSGRKLPDGSLKKLVEKIKFKDNSRRK